MEPGAGAVDRGDRNNNESAVGDDGRYAQAKQLINEAVQVMPEEEKSSYLRAMTQSPFLFEHNGESDPLRFMRRCNNNQWAAAQRICLYWKERIFLFGEKRAFRPMTLTGDGALNQQDISFVESGSPALLPDKTKKGQPIVYFDRRQWPNVKKIGYERVRALFYVYTVATENYDQAPTVGIYNLYLMNTPRMIYHEPAVIPIVTRAIYIVHNAMPIKLSGCSLNFPPRAKYLYDVQETITSSLQMLLRNGIDFVDIEYLFEREKGDIYKHLTEELGMSKAGIPTIAGGTWTFVNSLHWCKARFKHEVEHYRARLEQIRAEEPDVGVDRIDSYTRRGRPPASAKPDDKETKLFKKRAANAVLSRRKRQRRQHEEKLLHGEHSRLLQEQKALKEEHARLVSLVEDARRIAEDMPVEDGSPPRNNALVPLPQQADDPSFSVNNAWVEQQQPEQQTNPLDEMALDSPIRFDAPDDILAYLGI